MSVAFDYACAEVSGKVAVGLAASCAVVCAHTHSSPGSGQIVSKYFSTFLPGAIPLQIVYGLFYPDSFLDYPKRALFQDKQIGGC